MDKTKRADHLWRVSLLVDRLEGQLNRAGRLEDDTRQRLIRIRDGLTADTALDEDKRLPLPKK